MIVFGRGGDIRGQRTRHAAHFHGEAIARYRVLAGESDEGSLSYDFGRALGRFGNSLRLTGQYAQADGVLRAAIDRLRRQIQLDPSQRIYRLALGRSVEFQAQLIHDGNDAHRLPEARALLAEAIQCVESADQAQRTGRSRAILTTLHLLMAETLLRQGDHAAASPHACRVPSLRLDNGKVYTDAARLLQRCAKLAAEDGALPPDRRAERAGQYRRDAKQILAEAGRLGVRAAEPPDVE